MLRLEGPSKHGLSQVEINMDPFEHKKRANANFKYALRFIKRNEKTMRADSLAHKLQNNSHNDFWKEVRMLNNCKTSLPSNIDGVSGADEISQLWQKHYSDLFNCVKSNSYSVGSLDNTENAIVSIQEVYEEVMKLGNNKACGMDNITAEHLKLASKKLYPLLAICFTGLLVHGILPDSILSVVLVPVIKDKAGKLNSSENYRPIALASILSKVLEKILLNRLEQYILTTDNQFGFKRKHGTDMCIFALKEILDKYNRQNSTIFMCFIDASKAFDRVNHEKLFNKLDQRGVPRFIVRILVFWYAHQTMRVKWGNSVSTPFYVNNGVRQGGILSPFLFNIYMDDLSLQLNECGTGCLVGNSLINHLMYADDLVILCPYSAGLQQLLRICSQ
uniref:Reverse transcriptase domain-containing protein n=1 Tax=Sparus aurata TaxID=8175 RepID=A0A671UZC4_SPAAU